jgi:L-fuconolactonase
MRIDAHQHFWNYRAAEFGWIDESRSVIRRDFAPAELQAELARAGVDGSVSVQARQSLEETRWLLTLADRHDFIRGVVGWVPLASPTAREELAALAGHPRLVAVRHVLQDEPDPEHMLRPDFNAGLELLAGLGLAYDILIFERQLPQAIRMVDAHPGQVFVLDHAGKPLVREGALSPWRENLQALARRENVYCKLSGLVTEADFRAWTPGGLRPYLETALAAFGPRRIMFGSDWPACLAACAYARWLGVVEDFLAPLSASEREWIMGRTAEKAYRLANRPAGAALQEGAPSC